jgi:segregation and condensation protein B
MTRNKNLKSVLESLLFVAEKPVSTKELAGVTGNMVIDVQTTLREIEKDYGDRGIRLVRKGEYFSFVSASENAKQVSALLNEELRHDLSQAALETLAIITYKQPLTRMEIEEIRGVNTDQIVRSLMIRGLITEVGRKETVGKPILYGTTMEFVQYFGLDTEEKLPKIDELKLFENNNTDEG